MGSRRGGDTVGREHKIKIWAHRGASGYVPENTMEAFILAHQFGADGIELDVQLSKDDQVVVIHDEKIDRTSNGKGLVRNYTLKKLRTYTFNRTKPQYVRAPIPTLKEVLAYISGTGMVLNIELKNGLHFYPGLEQKTVDLVREFGMQDRVIYSSFNHYSLRTVREIEPEAKIGLLHDVGMIDMPEYGARFGAYALHPRWQCLQYPDFVEGCRRNSLLINAWTLNKEEEILWACRAGVNAIVTNYPDLAIKVRDIYEAENEPALV